jgi:hypothetical protein
VAAFEAWTDISQARLLCYNPEAAVSDRLLKLRALSPLELVELAFLALNEVGTQLQADRPPVFYAIDRLTRETENVRNHLGALRPEGL